MTTNPHLVITPEIGLDTVAELAAPLRVDSIRSSTAAGSGAIAELGGRRRPPGKSMTQPVDSARMTTDSSGG
ncbi:hypothetical protein ACFPJ1_07875 [Kribbella qitaiheensis]|uniref:hypothetical protein n=1 Tax=Kribbella qitaiheensis TaxID=1544730 RepID=UPI0036120584